MPPLIQHGFFPAYRDCACGLCVSARIAAKRGGAAPVADPLAHGTAATYTNHGCRCEPCRDASRAAYLQRRAQAWALKAIPAPAPNPHGTEATWEQCPCPICVSAYDESQRARRTRRRSPSRIPDSLIDRPTPESET